MTRAGREPAEDVKRRLEAACRKVGLRVQLSHFSLSPNRDSRCVLVSAALANLPHDHAQVEVLARVKTSGEVGNVEIHCHASNGEPMRMMYTAPTLRGCAVPLDQLPETLKAVLAERQAVIDAMADGKKPPFMIRWQWAVPFDEEGPVGPACP